jgi:hypothetical protein
MYKYVFTKVLKIGKYKFCKFFENVQDNSSSLESAVNRALDGSAYTGLKLVPSSLCNKKISC